MRKLIWNEVRQNKLMSAAAVFFMTISAALLALTVMLFTNLLGAIDSLMDKALVPDFMQMHAGTVDETELAGFAANAPEIQDWQLCLFLNLDNSQITLGGANLTDSTQDNGLCVQGERFDFLLGMDGEPAKALPGEIYVPVCYWARYGLSVGDEVVIGKQALSIAGFLRDAQMNSMMSSSKRFLVSLEDYEKLAGWGQEEYLIEFLLKEEASINEFQLSYTARGLPSNGPAITRPLIRMINALSDGTMIFVLLLVGIAVLLISMFCIHFILSLQMERDRKEMGMLKALGIGRRKIRGIYFAKYLLFSVCGALLGLAAAAAAQGPLARQLQELYGPGGQSALAGIFSLLTALLAEGIILLSVWRSLKKIDKLSALDALFQAQGKRRGWKQYLLISAVAAACTFLMLVPANLYNTLSAPVFVTYMGIGSGELRIDVRRTEDVDSVTARIADTLEHDAEVEKYAVLQTSSYAAILPDGETANLTVEMGDHLVFPVSFSAGVVPAGNDEIALSSLNAKEWNLSVGDTLRLLMDGREADYRVCGIYSDITNGGKTAKIGAVQSHSPVIWSIIYVSLNKSADRKQWIEQYRRMGADVTDIGDYVRDTYAQTLTQLRLASGGAAGIAVLVIAVVLVLFLRLMVERNRYEISLQKALGFTERELRRAYFARGLLFVGVGVIAGLALGNLWGEKLCGMILKALGADGFHFVIHWGQVLAGIPAAALGTAIPAIWAGIGGIRQIRAYECCRGKE